MRGDGNTIRLICKDARDLRIDSKDKYGLNIFIRGNNNRIKIVLPLDEVGKSLVSVSNDNACIEFGHSPHFNGVRIVCREGDGQVCKMPRARKYATNTPLLPAEVPEQQQEMTVPYG